MSSSELDQKNEAVRKASQLIYLLLIREQSKIPVKRVNIVKYVMKENKTMFNNVLEIANNQLSKVFGLEIVEIGEGSKRSYILRNKLGKQMVPYQNDAKRALLIIVLTLIFMSGNVIPDGTFWHALSKLGIEQGTKHPELGDVRKLIMTEFVRQMYLDVTRTPGSDPPQYTIQWGPRACQETKKMKLLEFVTDIYGKSDSAMWKSQYRDAADSNQ